MPRKRIAAALLPSAMGAVACVALARGGFLAPLFLLPLGISAYREAGDRAWLAAPLAILGNGIVAAVLAFLYPESRAGFLADAAYFGVVCAAFVWALTARGVGSLRLRLSYRLVLAAAAASLALWPIVAAASKDEGLVNFVRAQAQAVADFYAQGSGSDVVERSLTERYLTPDAILAAMRSVALRGAVLAAHLVFFIGSLRLSAFFARLFGGKRRPLDLRSFRVDGPLVWVLSTALAALPAGAFFGIEGLEIVAWNILVPCAFLYAAQGLGIAAFFLTRPTVTRGARFFANLLLLTIALTPGINAAAAAALVLLGVAETWLPLRAPHTNGTSSTPGM